MADDTGALGGNAKEKLKSIVERIERLNEQRKALSDDVAGMYKEAKSSGLNKDAVRAVVRRRSQDPGKLKELDSMVELYSQSIA